MKKDELRAEFTGLGENKTIRADDKSTNGVGELFVSVEDKSGGGMVAEVLAILEMRDGFVVGCQRGVGERLEARGKASDVVGGDVDGVFFSRSFWREGHGCEVPVEIEDGSARLEDGVVDL